MLRTSGNLDEENSLQGEFEQKTKCERERERFWIHAGLEGQLLFFFFLINISPGLKRGSTRQMHVLEEKDTYRQNREGEF